MLLARLQKKGTKIWLFAGVVLISAVAFFAWRVNFPAAQTPVYETQPAERGQLSASVTGTGTLRAGQSALIAWQISGRVENIQVGLNTVVSPGQELASLATDSLPKNTLLAQTDLVTAQKNLDQLLNTNLAQAQAQLDLANARQAVQDAQDQYETLLAPRGSQELLDDIKDQITQAQNQVKSLQKIYDRFFAHRPAGNPGKANMQLNLTRAKDNLTNLIARYNWFVGHPSEIAKAEALARIQTAETSLQDAQRALDEYSNGIDPADLAAAQARIKAARAVLEQARLRATFAGVISQVDVQLGDRVTAGQTAFRVDDLSSLVLDLQISEMDINNVTLGQPVEVIFEAVPEKTYHGTVTSVDLASDVQQGAVNFAVAVTLTDADGLVKPGMSAGATITVKSLDDALIVPNRAVRMLNGRHVVYVLRSGQPEAVEIQLGAMTDTLSEVAGGSLQAGDLVILNSPSASNRLTPTPAPQP